MESNWRMNVVKWGMAYFSNGLILRWPTLMAKRTDQPFTFITAAVPNQPTRYDQWFGSELTQQFNWLGTFVKPPGHPHFPYGIPVLPDH